MPVVYVSAMQRRFFEIIACKNRTGGTTTTTTTIKAPSDTHTHELARINGVELANEVVPVVVKSSSLSSSSLKSN